MLFRIRPLLPSCWWNSVCTGPELGPSAANLWFQFQFQQQTMHKPHIICTNCIKRVRAPAMRLRVPREQFSSFSWITLLPRNMAHIMGASCVIVYWNRLFLTINHAQMAYFLHELQNTTGYIFLVKRHLSCLKWWRKHFLHIKNTHIDWISVNMGVKIRKI